MEAIHVCVGQFGNRMGALLAGRLKAEGFGRGAVLVDSEPKVVAEAGRACGEGATAVSYQSGRGNNFAMGYAFPGRARVPTRHFASPAVAVRDLEAFVEETQQSHAAKPNPRQRAAAATGAADWEAGGQFPEGENAAMLQRTGDAVRKQLEQRAGCPALMFYLAAAGGTGSGFGARLWSHFAEEYPDLGLLGALLLPASFGENALQSLNVVLCVAHASKNLEGFLYFKNDALLREVCAPAEGGAKPRGAAPDFAALDALVADRLAHLYLCLAGFEDTSLRDCFGEAVFGPCKALRLCAQPVHKQRYAECVREAAPRKPPLAASWLLGETAREEMTVAELLDFRRAVCAAGGLSRVGRVKPGQPVPLLCALVNDGEVVGALAENAARSRVLVGQGAYLHHFERFGLDRFELVQAIEDVDALVDAYRAFTA